jgi:F-type H+-transporting ATPase subunit epsilon
MPLQVSIVTPEQDVLDMECDEVVVPGVNGDLGLLPDHIPLISALQPGVLTTHSGGKATHYVVSSGFVEIDDNRVSILTGTCDEARGVDVDRATKALAAAQDKANGMSPDDPGYAKAQFKIARNRARLDGADRAR